MIATKQSLWFSLLTIISIGIYLALGPFSETVNAFVLIFFLITTGIPHGAIDHIIYRENRVKDGKEKSLLKEFFVPYFLLMALTVMLWMVLPSFTFWAFLLIAAYHFGQSQLYYFSLPGSSLGKFLLYCLWGAMVLSWLWILNWDAQIPHLQSIFSWDLSRAGFMFSFVQYVSIFSLVLFFIVLAYFVYSGIISLFIASVEAAISMLLIYMFYALPMYVSFGIYFGLWHSTRVILTEFSFLKAKANKPITFLSFAKSFLPFSILSFAGLGLLLLACYLLKSYITPFMIFLIFISALTIPHAYFMEIMYGWLGKTRAHKKALSLN